LSGDRTAREKGIGQLNAESFLRVPPAHGEPVGRATLRTIPEDFQVHEWLGFEADGDGDHMLLQVRKRSANTFWVAKQLARMAQVHPRDVGYAGLKDRDAIAEQSFTVPLRSKVGEQWAGRGGEGFEVLSASRHRRKLKRGALKGNGFRIVLREFRGDLPSLEQRLQVIRARGVPNYFGPQRFGKEGYNLTVAQRWFNSGEPPQDRLLRGFAISAARSAVFNAVLAHRVEAGTWNRLMPGELANLNGTGSVFAVDAIDAQLEARCEQMDIHPSGPLWHGDTTASQEAGALEREVAARCSELCSGLAQVGLDAERRALRAKVDDLAWSIDSDVVTLSFRLSKGCFATAVLHELIDQVFLQDVPEVE
jgi:tRNA pseudouridine13 synthase